MYPRSIGARSLQIRWRFARKVRRLSWGRAVEELGWGGFVSSEGWFSSIADVGFVRGCSAGGVVYRRIGHWTPFIIDVHQDERGVHKDGD